MRLLLFGRNGQLGWELQRALAPLGEVIALDRAGDATRGWCGDLEDPEGLARTIRAVAPDVIVNAAAYTAVDRAETDVARAMLCNAQAPGRMAHEAAACGAWLVHYSTDYVFDGSGDRPHREDDATGPLNVYGQSKLQGEQALRASGCLHLILRTSWVHALRGGNFAKTMLRLGRERASLQVVDDQFGAPTGADLLADATSHALRAAMSQPALSGTYHVTAGGATSWHGYARHLFEHVRSKGHTLALEPGGLHAVASSAFPTPARRPRNSRLDTSKFRQAFGLALPPWEQGVERLLDELLLSPWEFRP